MSPITPITRHLGNNRPLRGRCVSFPRPGGTIAGAAVLTAVIFISSQPAMASEFFGGGMALHTSYVNFTTIDGPIRGFLHGLGGRLHFNLGDHFRWGGLGASVKIRYGREQSYFELGYGGVFAEFVHRFSRGTLCAGAAVGGGKVSNLHVYSRLSGQKVTARFDQHATFVLLPMIGGEYSLGSSISLALMADYIIGPGLGTAYSLGSPKLQAGVLFKR